MNALKESLKILNLIKMCLFICLFEIEYLVYLFITQKSLFSIALSWHKTKTKWHLFGQNLRPLNFGFAPNIVPNNVF